MRDQVKLWTRIEVMRWTRCPFRALISYYILNHNAEVGFHFLNKMPCGQTKSAEILQTAALRCSIPALPGVAQWIEGRPVNRKVAGLIPSQGTCLGCRPAPPLGAHERQPHIDVSLFLTPFPSLYK